MLEGLERAQLEVSDGGQVGRGGLDTLHAACARGDEVGDDHAVIEHAQLGRVAQRVGADERLVRVRVRARVGVGVRVRVGVRVSGQGPGLDEALYGGHEQL